MSTADTITVVALSLICSIVPIWIGNRLGAIRYFSPLHLCGAMAFFGVTTKVIYYQFNPHDAFYLRHAVDEFALLWGVFYVTSFVMAICLGYVLLYPRRKFAGRYVNDQSFEGLRHSRILVPAAFLSVLGIVYMLFAQRGLSILDPRSLIIMNSEKQFDINSDGVGSTGSLVKAFLAIPRVIFIICVMRAVASGNIKDVLGAIIVFFALVISVFVSGDRFDFVRLIAFYAIAAVLAGWVARPKSLAVLVIGGSLALVSVGLMSTMRAQEIDNEISLAEGIERVVEHALESTYFLDVNVSAILVTNMDADHLLHGDSYTWWTFGWIPRALWPEKPSTDVGTYLKRDVLGYGLDAPGAINVTGPGEAFINFGWYGIFVGLALGGLYRVLELATLFHRYRRRTRYIYYPVVVVPLIFSTLQSSFSAAIVSSVLIAVLAYSVKVFFLSDRLRSMALQLERNEEFRQPT